MWITLSGSAACHQSKGRLHGRLCKPLRKIRTICCPIGDYPPVPVRKTRRKKASRRARLSPVDGISLRLVNAVLVSEGVHRCAVGGVEQHEGVVVAAGNSGNVVDGVDGRVGTIGRVITVVSAGT